MGEIVAVAPDVTTRKVGDRVGSPGANLSLGEENPHEEHEEHFIRPGK